MKCAVCEKPTANVYGSTEVPLCRDHCKGLRLADYYREPRYDPWHEKGGRVIRKILHDPGNDAPLSKEELRITPI